MSKNVLIVDDSIYMRALIRVALETEDYTVVGEASDGQTAFELALDLKPNIITLDNILPDMLGFDVMDMYNEHGLKFKVIMISATGQTSALEEAQSKGIDQYLVKPFDTKELLSKMSTLTTNFNS